MGAACGWVVNRFCTCVYRTPLLCEVIASDATHVKSPFERASQVRDCHVYTRGARVEGSGFSTKSVASLLAVCLGPRFHAERSRFGPFYYRCSEADNIVACRGRSSVDRHTRTTVTLAAHANCSRMRTLNSYTPFLWQLYVTSGMYGIYCTKAQHVI